MSNKASDPRARLFDAGRTAYYRAMSALPLPARRRLLYAVKHRRFPRVRDPRTYTEKINWRILHDRRDLLVRTCDKLAMKEYAAERAGDLVRIPETYWHGVDLRELADVELPSAWVLKPTQGTMRVIFGAGAADVPDLLRRTAGWLDEFNSEVLGEWAYSRAERQFLVEEFIGAPGSSPDDYKIFVFDGEPRLVEVHQGRFTQHVERMYTCDWEPLTVTNRSSLAPVVDRPETLDRMLAAAAALGAGFDFLRVDLYNVDGVVWFGETSPYPSSGLAPFSPRSFDRQLGDWWTLPAL
ncbi:ATP-grasp fold amidoligase family protein [Blastococcus atacamensis]|uniref:ATP-grasp fold amidoligase family protein n=1 Tax=Blastococcus atacamensis TaxID=2070508 RepID=UPI000CEBF4C6|nr:ATP-grasp fold amidoligase family protein [Blastococcus atacamensis]